VRHCALKNALRILIGIMSGVSRDMGVLDRGGDRRIKSGLL